MIDDDPLLSALAALSSPPPDAARAERVRLHLRALVEPAATPLVEQAGRLLAPIAVAACVVTYLGWTVGRVTEGGPGHVVASEGNAWE